MLERKCPVLEIMEVLGGKWKIPVLWEIGKAKNIRYNLLKREVTEITNIMLTRTLTELIENGLVMKKDFNENPPRVEYSLTATGLTLYPHLQNLVAWIKTVDIYPNEDTPRRPYQRGIYREITKKS